MGKINIFVVLVFLLCQSLCAQMIKEGAEWVYESELINAFGYYYDTIRVTGPTQIDGQDCFAISHSVTEQCYPQYDEFYMYQDADQVYQWNVFDSTFHIFFDFGWNEGDTVSVKNRLPDQLVDYLDSSGPTFGEYYYIRVDSICMTAYQTQSLKAFHLSVDYTNESEIDFTQPIQTRMIEDIGSTGNPFIGYRYGHCPFTDFTPLARLESYQYDLSFPVSPDAMVCGIDQLIWAIDTIEIYDTIFVNDTVFIVDTTFIVDTLIITDSLIFEDTLTFVDTVPFFDTIVYFDTVQYFDTISSAIEIRDDSFIKSIYPNPFVDIIQWDCGRNIQSGTYSLYDPQGKLIVSSKFDCSPEQGFITNLNDDLPIGLYLLFLSDEEGEIVSSHRLLRSN